jgi:hypothetical protein
VGSLAGHQWQPREIAGWCYDAGWKDAFLLVTAVAVVLAESQGYDRAVNTNPDGSIDRGIFQLNNVHKNITDYIAYDPVAATDAAFGLYVSRGSFADWAAHQSGVWLHDSYLGRATRGVGNMLADRLLQEPVPDHADGTPYVHAFTTPVLSFQHQTGGMLAHLKQGRKLLGWKAANMTVVGSVQTELAHGEAAAKAPLP